MIDIAASRLAASQIAIDGAAYSPPSIDVKSIDSSMPKAGAGSSTSRLPGYCISPVDAPPA